VTYRVQFGVGVEQKVSRAEATRLASLIEIKDLVNDPLDRQARGDKEDCRASAKPMPCDEPVTSARFPVRLKRSILKLPPEARFVA